MQDFNPDIHNKILDSEGVECGFMAKEVKQEEAQPIRKITKLAFTDRLIPYWPEYEAAKADMVTGSPVHVGLKVAHAMSLLDTKFAMFSHIDNDSDIAKKLIGELVDNVLATDPESQITVSDLMRDGVLEEAY